MKKVVILFILLYMVVFPAMALADTGDVEAGLTPDSRFYWFDRMAERIIALFLLHPQDKANALSKTGLERLAEAQEVDDEATVGELISEFLTTQKDIQLIAGQDIDSLVGLSEDQLEALDYLDELLEYGEGEIEYRAGDALSLLNKILDRQIVRLSKIDLDKHPHKAKKITTIISQTTDRLNKLIDKLAKSSDEDQEESNEVAEEGSKKTLEEKVEHVTASTSKHIEVLENNYINAPLKAKDSLEKAIDKSSNGIDSASGAVGRQRPVVTTNNESDPSNSIDGSSTSSGAKKAK